MTYTLISIVAFSWFPLTLNYNPEKPPKSDEICQLKRPIVYKIFGTISVIFTYIGTKKRFFLFHLNFFFFYYLVPFIFLGILNILIVSRLHARQQTSIQRSIGSSCNTYVDATLGSASTRKRQRQRNTDRNITFMLIAVAIAFMVMSFPFQ